MRAQNGRRPPEGSVSLWMAGKRAAAFPALQEDEETDVCIVGGGLTGLTLAYLLAPSHRVLVLEKNEIGSGDTGRSTGHLTCVLDDDYGVLIKRFGEDGAATAVKAHGAAVNFIESVIAKEKLDSDFERVDGWLVGEPGEDERIERKADAARRAGIADAVLEISAPFEGRRAGPCLRFPRQAQLDPWRYVQGLAQAVAGLGGVIRSGSAVTRITESSRASVLVEVGHGPIVRASALVVATHAPLGGKPGIHARLQAHRTYVITGLLPKGKTPRALAWDTASPYHYVRRAPHSASDDLLIVGGEDHRTGEASDAARRYESLERWARERFPSLGPIEHRWSGQVYEPSGGLGFVGRAPGHHGQKLFVTGHSGNGLTIGTLSAILLASLLREGDHAWSAVFDPGRKTLDAAIEAAKQGATSVAQVGDRFTAEELTSSDQVAPGAAAVVGKGASRLAVYREPGGRLWECSAICSHMGCVVRWNEGERSWDCPCHGSRFDAGGRVLEGPALRDLTPVPSAQPR